MTYPLLRLYDGYDNTSPDLADEVEFLQRSLKAAGIEVGIDGKYGTGTQDAVVAFQRSRGLPQHGVADAATWAALLGTTPPPEDAFPTTYPRNEPNLARHEAAARAYEAAITSGAAAAGVPRAIIAAIGSRESGWGVLNRPQGPAGTGDFIHRGPRPPLRPGPLPPDGAGFGRGLMHVDFDAHEFARTGPWQDPARNIAYGCTVLTQIRRTIAAKLSLGDRQLLRATIAGYNCGAGNVIKALNTNVDVDFFTAGRDYSKDVINRAGWFQQRGW